MSKSKKQKPTKKAKVRKIQVVGERDDVADADAAETAAHGAHTAPTGADDAASGPTDAADDTAQQGADVAPTGEAEPRRRRAAKLKEPKTFTHDPRVAALVGQSLSHTDRNGTTHTVAVLDDGFEYNGQRFKSLSAAAKAATGGKSVNGLLFFGVVKSAARAATKKNPVEVLDRAFARYRDRADAILKGASAEDRGKVEQAIRDQANALLDVTAMAQT